MIDIVALERNVVKLMTVGSTLTFVENVLQRGVTQRKVKCLAPQINLTQMQLTNSQFLDSKIVQRRIS